MFTLCPLFTAKALKFNLLQLLIQKKKTRFGKVCSSLPLTTRHEGELSKTERMGAKECTAFFNPIDEHALMAELVVRKERSSQLPQMTGEGGVSRQLRPYTGNKLHASLLSS